MCPQRDIDSVLFYRSGVLSRSSQEKKVEYRYLTNDTANMNCMLTKTR